MTSQPDPKDGPPDDHGKCICPDEPCGEGPCVSLTGKDAESRPSIGGLADAVANYPIPMAWSDGRRMSIGEMEAYEWALLDAANVVRRTANATEAINDALSLLQCFGFRISGPTPPRFAAALRVVPPEGADNAVHLTVAWNAFSRAWPYETTPTLRDALFVAVEAALESAALRASGAGTRQEEPPWRDLATIVAGARVMWERYEDSPPEEGSAIDIVERWIAESRPNE